MPDLRPMTLRPLAPADLPGARALLASARLPVDDLVDPAASAVSLVGAFDDAALVGVVGLQRCDGAVLLRSLAVAPGHRGRGIAALLCGHVLGVTTGTVWLLTTSAADYFTRLGFEHVARDEAPAAIRATAQFTSLCPSTARVMRRR